MSKLVLYFQNSVIKEMTLHGGTVTVGRNPDNDICIDNQAVSSHHAKITDEGEQVFIEDLDSTNGTYVNDRKIDGYNLKDGDKVFIGKHHILFRDDSSAAEAASRIPADTGIADRTVAIDMSKVKSKVKELSDGPARGNFKVTGGNTDKPEYRLKDRATTIGKTQMADIKLKGLFAPKVAAMVNRSSSGYFITPVGTSSSRVKVNGEAVSGRHKLEDGDMVEVCKTSFQFYLGD